MVLQIDFYYLRLELVQLYQLLSSILEGILDP